MICGAAPLPAALCAHKLHGGAARSSRSASCKTIVPGRIPLLPKADGCGRQAIASALDRTRQDAAQLPEQAEQNSRRIRNLTSFAKPCNGNNARVAACTLASQKRSGPQPHPRLPYDVRGPAMVFHPSIFLISEQASAQSGLDRQRKTPYRFDAAGQVPGTEADTDRERRGKWSPPLPRSARLLTLSAQPAQNFTFSTRLRFPG